MALKKIKDLIRELIFETHENEQAYTNAMNEIVFNRDSLDIYDQKLTEAENIDQKYDEKIQKINRALERKNEKLDLQKSKKSLISPEQFKIGMATLNKQKNILKDLQKKTITEKMNSGFKNLDSNVKKYACFRHLINECIKNENFPTTKKDDGFLYTDEDEFKASEIASRFREISDYIDHIFSNRESKITEPQSVIEIIKNDAKDSNIDFKKITSVDIVNVYNSLLEHIAKERSKNQQEQEQIELSQIGLELVQDFGDGLAMYRLLPDKEHYDQKGTHRNLVYESNQMGICIGNTGQHYSKMIFDEQNNQYYTLRSREPNGQLVPHCTIEVCKNIVRQVKGKGNRAVNINYVKQVQDFLKNYLNCAFPGEDTKNKRQLQDTANIGFICDAHGKTVNAFDLPPDTELDEVEFDFITTKGINLEHIKSIERISFAGITISQKEVKKLASMVHINRFNFGEAKLIGDWDFSNIDDLHLRSVDFSKANNIKINPNAKRIILTNPVELKSELDFSGVRDLHMNNVSVPTSIKLNPNADFISLQNVYAVFQGDLDFSNVKFLDLYEGNLSNVNRIKFNPNSEKISIFRTQGLKDDIDFSKVKNLALCRTDLSNVTNIKFNSNAKTIDLSGSSGLKGDLDFSGVEDLCLNNTDLSNVSSIKFNPNAKIIKISNTKGLRGDLDFSNVTNLRLSETDLSNVTSIKFNPNASDIDLSASSGLKGDLDFSNVENLSLDRVDLSNVSNIKFNSNATRINLSRTKGLKGFLDFGKCSELKVDDADLSKISGIKAPNLYLRKTQTLRGDLDLSQVDKLDLSDADLSKLSSIKLNPNAKDINLENAKGLKGYLDFGQCEDIKLGTTDLSKVSGIKAEHLYLNRPTRLNPNLDLSAVQSLTIDNTDFSNAPNIKFNPNANFIAIYGSKGLKGNLDFSGVKEIQLSRSDFSNVSNIKFNPNAKEINLHNSKGFQGVLDFGNTERIYIHYADLSKATIKAKKLDFQYDTELQGDLDFSGVEELIFYRADLSKVNNIKFNPHAKRIILDTNQFFKLKGDVDFSGVEELELSSALDLSKTTSIKFNPNARELNLADIKGLKGDLDFSGVKKLDLLHAVLTDVKSIKFNPNADYIRMRTATKTFTEDLDFSGVKELNIGYADLSKVNSVKFNPHATAITLDEIKGLKGELDFSRVKSLTLVDTDLSNVTSIKLNPFGQVYGLSIKDRLNFGKNRLMNKLAEKFGEPITKPDYENDGL